MKRIKIKVKKVRRSSPYFICPNCGFRQAMLVKGDTTISMCPNCGKARMIREK